MIFVCIFVPFLHEETPKPQNIVKIELNKDSQQVLFHKVKELIDFRNKIVEI